MTPTSPPFDGSAPCPACPSEVRGLFATVNNYLKLFAHDPARAWSPTIAMVGAGVAPSKLPADLHPSIRGLHLAVHDFMIAGVRSGDPHAFATGIGGADARAELQTALDRLYPLVETHFIDTAHWMQPSPWRT